MDGDILGAVVAVGVDEEGEWGGGERSWRRRKRGRQLADAQSATKTYGQPVARLPPSGISSGKFPIIDPGQTLYSD